MKLFKKKEKRLLNEFLSECSEWHSLIHGIWTGAKGVKWETLPKEARKEIKKEWQYFELGQIIGWLLKIGLAALVLRVGVGAV